MNATRRPIYFHDPLALLCLAFACAATDEPRTDAVAPAGADGRPALHANVAVGLEDELPGVEASSLAAGDGVMVQTADASVRGLTSGSVEQFLGIPYAEAPVGALRFRPPMPLPLAGALDATLFGNQCLQGTSSNLVGDEDCLFLNVYRPANVDASQRLPVLFWIHGGSFTSGAGSEYDPRRLVETNGIIVVTINYRLGPLGFLALPALSEEAGAGLSGDYGLMDQQAALRWVNANIATFGGDAARVTIAGESAGGASVCAQLTSPLAAGLFSQAIIQSASCVAIGVADAERFGIDTAAVIGCSTPSDHLRCLRNDKTAADIVGKGAGVYGVVAGGNLLPAAPDAVVRAGLPRAVPVLIGGLRDEIAFFAAYFPAYFGLTEQGYAPTLAALFPALTTSEITTRYPIEGRPAPQPFFAISAVASDSGFFYGSSTFIYSQALGGCVTARVADALALSTTTFAYELDDPSFAWATQTTRSPLQKGASHTSDLPFLFELSAPLSQPFNDAQNTLADQMVRAWGAFVETGDPGTTTDPWPVYTAADPSMLHLEPGAVSTTNDFRERHHCDFWKASLALP
jgi:para-nitrobenzyl esterase